MNSNENCEKYAVYKSNVIRQLSATREGQKNGVWKRNGKTMCHILPLKGEQNTPTNRAVAIKTCLNFNCSPFLQKGYMGLHQYAHHLNSSQLLCMMFFSKLIDENSCATEKLVNFMKDAFGISIDKNAKCTFEYKEEEPKFMIEGKKQYEGTSFDFHIAGSIEVFFEIKFTEYGFGKAEKDSRHYYKAKQYKDRLPKFLKDKLTEDDILNHYQLIRNIIRAENAKKIVIFITDKNNPSTNKALSDFKELLKAEPANIKFKTWQDIKGIYSKYADVPFQFKAI